MRFIPDTTGWLSRPNRRERGISLLVVAGVLAAGACSPVEEGSSSATVRDSAGILVTENPRAAQVPRWHVEDAPVVEIGSVEGERPYRLHDVERVLRLSDGRVVVADGGSRELRYFGPGGDHLYVAGGEGEGPGEFARLSDAHLMRGDTVVAWDLRQRRISVFDAEGSFVRSLELQAPADRELPPRLSRVFRDGRLLAGSTPVRGPEDIETGVPKQYATYLLYSRDGSLLDTVGRFQQDEYYYWVYGGGQGFLVNPLPFGHSFHLAVGPDLLHLARNHRSEVLTLSPEGELLRVLRRERVPRPVTEADIEVEVERRLSRAEQDEWRKRLRRAFRELTEYPETMPVLSDLQVDAAGNLWVEEYRPPAEGGPSTWSVFGPEGRLRAEVELHPGFDPHQIGNGWILGVAEDEFDVEHVRLHRMARGNG